MTVKEARKLPIGARVKGPSNPIDDFFPKKLKRIKQTRWMVLERERWSVTLIDPGSFDTLPCRVCGVGFAHILFWEASERIG